MLLLISDVCDVADLQGVYAPGNLLVLFFLLEILNILRKFAKSRGNSSARVRVFVIIMTHYW